MDTDNYADQIRHLETLVAQKDLDVTQTENDSHRVRHIWRFQLTSTDIFDIRPYHSEALLETVTIRVIGDIDAQTEQSSCYVMHERKAARTYGPTASKHHRDAYTTLWSRVRDNHRNHHEESPGLL
ncbi:hypothetical protein DPMN_176099 [Dreissena polymorpha]|uniref:Uncharacterized protein n=1 Tax=Dreissena polymorpha TaxID=45954 RepID=A0A9D4IK87_DREPO|nr:hypothetical protein DPMN_176099 [Dreissena polymorpha]